MVAPPLNSSIYGSYRYWNGSESVRCLRSSSRSISVAGRTLRGLWGKALLATGRCHWPLEAKISSLFTTPSPNLPDAVPPFLPPSFLPFLFSYPSFFTKHPLLLSKHLLTRDSTLATPYSLPAHFIGRNLPGNKIGNSVPGNTFLGTKMKDLFPDTPFSCVFRDFGYKTGFYVPIFGLSGTKSGFLSPTSRSRGVEDGVFLGPDPGGRLAREAVLVGWGSKTA